MFTHELAKLLLEGPDVEISVMAAPGVTNHIQGIASVLAGSYPAPSWDDNAGSTRDVVVLMATGETLNEDEAFTFPESKHK
jgi:hypothetical protein